MAAITTIPPPKLDAPMVWVYTDPNVNYLIMKRHPFSHQITNLDFNGQYSLRLQQGHGIDTPRVWDWIARDDASRLVFAQTSGHLYEITDLFRVQIVYPR
jgi:hypothetical protein